MKSAIFRRNFDEILQKKMPEFHRNGQEMTKCLEILRKSARKIRKNLMPEISGIFEKLIFHFSFDFFNPLLRSSPPAPLEAARPGAMGCMVSGSTSVAWKRETDFYRSLEGSFSAGSTPSFAFRAVRKCENLVDLERCEKMRHFSLS